MKLVVIFSLIAFSKTQNELKFRPFDWLCLKPILCDDEKNYFLKRIIQRVEGSFHMRKNIIFLLNAKDVRDYAIENNNQQSLLDSGFDPNLPTRVIIHGFLNNATSRINQILSKGYLLHNNVNVIKGKREERFLKLTSFSTHVSIRKLFSMNMSTEQNHFTTLFENTFP